MTTNITILKTEHPFLFWGKEVPGPGESHETRQFQDLCEEIQEYCLSDQFVIEHVRDPVKGKMYLAQRPNDSKWYRVRVIHNLQAAHGIKSKCHLVDYADSFLVPINRLKEIPARLKAFPSQAKPFRLHGIQPTTLQVYLEEDSAEIGTSDKWDIAAVEFFENLVTDRSAQVDVHFVGRKETRFVTLYVLTSNGQVNVNEELMRLNFAVKAERDMDEISEIGSSEGACSRAMTPMTFTPRMLSPTRSVPAAEDDGNAWTPGGGSSSGRSASQSPVRTMNEVMIQRRMERQSRGSSAERDVRERTDDGATSTRQLRDASRIQSSSADPVAQKSRGHTADEDKYGLDSEGGQDPNSKPDIAERIAQLGQKRSDHSSMVPRSEAGIPGVESGQGEMDDHEGRPVFSPETVGRGRGLAALANLSDVGRKRSMSPPSNIVRSDGLQKAVAKRRSEGSSPLRDKVVQPLAPQSTPPPGENKSKVVPHTTRLPFLRDTDVRPKMTTAATGSHHRPSSTSPPQLTSQPPPLSPPSFVSPVSTIQPSSKLPWKQGIHRRGASQGYSSSDWNKTSGNSDTSDQERVPERPKEPVSTKSPPAKSPLTKSPPVKSPSAKPSQSERAQIIQDSLTKQLKLNEPEADSPPRGTTSDHHHGYDLGVVIHGQRPPDPIKDISKAPFPDIIKKTFQGKSHKSLTLIQAYAWPAVLRGRDLVGVAPRDTDKTTAYLLPIITQVLQPATYTSLPPGNGPLALIICPSWKQASTVFDACQTFVKAASKTVRTILLHGGGNERQQEVQLVNGCQIMVSTLPCFLRMMNSNHTNVNRLCHLVFEEAHILFRDFLQEVRQLMAEFAQTLRVQQQSRSAPRQLLVFSSEWSLAIGSFLRSYMANQLVVITHRLEAAMYACVRQNVELVEESQKTQVLLGKLQSGLAQGTKLIIFAASRKMAHQVAKILSSSSFYTLLAVDDMPSDAREKVKREWTTHHRPDSIPLLVMTDGAVNDLNITDASLVVHYDFPSNKRQYGRRLGCMMRHFQSQLEKKKESNCQSLSFVSPDNIHVLAHLSALLFRSNQKFPPRFNLQQITQAKEARRKHKPLCYQVKAFGACRDELRCPDRHRLFADIDEPGTQPEFIDLPRQGTVMVRIIYVNNASHFYVRLLKHRLSDDHKTVAMGTDYVQLTLDLQEFYADPARRVGQRPVALGGVCGLRGAGGTYSRVRVHSWFSQATDDSPATVKVQHVDEGHWETVSIEKLLILPENLRKVKFQAVEMFVGRVKPVDGDYSWTTSADIRSDKLLESKELEGKIVLSLGNTLWLDPLVQRTMLAGTKSLTTILNVRKEMMDSGFAADNPEHISKLKSLCEGQVTLPRPTPVTQVSKDVKLPAPARLSEEAPSQVYLSAIDTPDLLYVQLRKTHYRLESLMQALNSKMASHVVNGECEVEVGELCIAKFPLDGRWYRARLTDKNDETDERDLFFFDYGDQEWVPKGHVCPMPYEVTDLGPQAIQCSLEAIAPKDPSGWPEKASDALWDMCIGDGVDVKVPLLVEVVSTELCEFTGGYHYSVKMYDETAGEKVLLTKRLVDAGLAQPTQDFMKVMLSPPRALDNDQRDPSHNHQQLHKVCAQLYQVKSSQGQLGLVRKINDLIASESESWTLIDSGFIRALCQVMCNGQLKETAKEQLVLSLIRLSTESSRMSCEIATEGGLKSILALLQKTPELKLKEDISSFIRDISVEKRPRDLFLAAGGLQILKDQLDLDNSSLVISNVCRALENLIFYNVLVGQQMDAAMILSLCRIVNQTEETSKLSAVLRVLSDLAGSHRNRELILNHFGLQAACSRIWCAKEDEVIRHVASLLKHLASDRDSRTVMIEEELQPCLESHIVSLRTTNETKEVLSSLLDALDQHEIYMASFAQSQRALPPPEELTIPKTHPFPQSDGQKKKAPCGGGGDASMLLEGEEQDDFDDMPPLLESEIEELQKCHPKILWSQKPNLVLLSVQLRGVKCPVVDVTSCSIHFSAILESVQYEFSLALFSRVDTSNYTVALAGREVLITLYKESIGIKWTRLVQDKEKIPYIGNDFERWKDEDEFDPEEPKVVKAPPKKAPYSIRDPGYHGEEDNGLGNDSDDSDDHSDYSGDEFDKAFEEMPGLHKSGSDSDLHSSGR